jgi:hypothetical protein
MLPDAIRHLLNRGLATNEWRSLVIGSSSYLGETEAQSDVDTVVLLSSDLYARVLLLLEDPHGCSSHARVVYGLSWARVPLLCIHTHQGKQFDVQFLFIKRDTTFSSGCFLLNPRTKLLWSEDVISARRSVDSILFGSRMRYAIQATCAIMKIHHGTMERGITKGEAHFWVVFKQVRSMAKRNRVYGTLKGYPGGASWLLLTLAAFQHLAFLLHRRNRPSPSPLFSAAYVFIFLEGIRWDSEQIRCWGAMEAHGVVAHGVKTPAPGGTVPTLSFTGVCDAYNNFLFHASIENLSGLHAMRKLGTGPYVCLLSYDATVTVNDWAVWCSLLEREAVDRIPADYGPSCRLRLFPKTFHLPGPHRCIALIFELMQGGTPSMYTVCSAETSLWHRLNERMRSVSVGNRLDGLRSPTQGVLDRLPAWIKRQSLD